MRIFASRARVSRAKSWVEAENGERVAINRTIKNPANESASFFEDYVIQAASALTCGESPATLVNKLSFLNQP